MCPKGRFSKIRSHIDKYVYPEITQLGSHLRHEQYWGVKNPKEHILHCTAYSTFTNTWQFLMYRKLHAREMTADQDADWIIIGFMFYKRSQVQQSLQT